MLNDPVGYDERGDEPEWTPARGLQRAAVYGGGLALGLALLSIPILAWAPYMLVMLWMRVPVAFGLAALLFRVVHMTAGMAGPACTALALGLTAVVLALHHVPLIQLGVPFSPEDADWWTAPLGLVSRFVPLVGGELIGLAWLHPAVLLILNGLPLIVGGGLAAAFHRRG